MRIRTNLFLVTLATILLLSLAFAAGIFIWQMPVYRERVLNRHAQDARSVLRQLDDELASMNSVSLSVVYSNLIKDEFRTAADSGQEVLQRTLSTRHLSELVFSIIGPGQWVPQVYIYANDGGAFGNGIDNGYRDYDAGGAEWYEQTAALGGRRYITAPGVNVHIAQASPLEAERQYISLVRVFFDSLNVRQGFVEVVQRADKVFDAVEKASGGEAQLAVFLPEGGCVYSGAAAPLDDALLNLYRDRAGQWLGGPQNSFVMFLPSEQSDFVLMTMVPQSAVTSQYLQLVRILIVASLLCVALISPVVFGMAGAVSKPIRRLHRSIAGTDLESIPDERFEPPGTSVVEVVELANELRRMKFKISDSMQRLLLTEKHETQARMLALQAQTNPHFIFNTLATISAMASDGMTGQIEEMCADISDLLRYISSDRETLVTVRDELAITQKYVDCIQLRFSALEYHSVIPPEMLDLPIPKLAVQSLVENAVKHVTSGRAPWRILVGGLVDGSGWTVTVEDNGPGFPPTVRTGLLEQMARIRETGALPTLELEGMGLLNLYIRMHLLCGRELFFRLEDAPGGGARVTIGQKSPPEPLREEEKYGGG